MTKLPKFIIHKAWPSKPEYDTLCLGITQNSQGKPILPKGPYLGILKRMAEKKLLTGKAGSTHFVRFGAIAGAENLLIVGLGKTDQAEKLRVAGANAHQKLVAEHARSLLIDFGSLAAPKVAHFVEGIVLKHYTFEKHFSEAPSKKKDAHAFETFGIVCAKATLARDIQTRVDRLVEIGRAINITRDWSNEPSNIGTPEYFASEAQALAKEYGLKCKVLNEADAKREKMGLFLGVGQGAEREGRLVVLEYHPKKTSKNTKTIALVGKGVTFDSGGISIKPSLKMEDMKHDMTGAATMMGVSLLAARFKIPHKLITIMAFTENMPDGTAIQPGNILKSRAGKTVEIINTDAEGRLILADALDYIQDLYKPEIVIDAATLTGAVAVALGKICAGLLGNNDSLLKNIQKAGEEMGEKLWPLPTFDEYFEDLKSDVADMKNSANDPYGGTIRGAIFLKQFIHKNTKWAHLDIAATAWGLTHLGYFPKRGASGAHVRTLINYLENYV